MSEFAVSPAAEAIWLQHLSRRLGGEPVDLEQLRAAHPRFAPEFERLEQAWSRGSPDGGDLSEPSLQTRDARLKTVLERLARLRPATAKYESRGEIGRGGMGVVQRVWDASLKRELALKTIHASFGAAREQALARFVEEAQILAQLDHPSIVPIHDLGLDQQGRPYFVMKLVVGRDLGAIFALVREQREGWTTTRALDVLLRVCEAVGYAHRKAVVHRDLKPSNVMVGELGEVYVMDWGIARVLQDGRVAALDTVRSGAPAGDGSDLLHTGQGDIVGTVAYMAPEQARGELEHVTSRSDVYALGAMLYELLSGRQPYARPNASSRETLLALLAGPPPPLDSVTPRASGELAAICAKAMARDAAQRYADLAEVALDLRAYLEGRVVRAHRTGVWVEAAKWVRRNKALASVAGVAIAASVVGAVTFVLQARETAARSSEVFALSVQADLDDLLAQAEQLWPPHAGLLADYDRWLATARRLTADGPPEAAREGEWSRSLGGLRSLLAELRTQAKPLSPEQLAIDRDTHPAQPELTRLRAELVWRQRMLGLEPWPREDEVREALGEVLSRASGVELIGRVDDAIGSDWKRYGREVEALVLAHKALEIADDDLAPFAHDRLARALYKVGRFEESLAHARLAMQWGNANHSTVSVDDISSAARGWDDRDRCLRVCELYQIEIARLEAQLSQRRTFEYDESSSKLAWWDAQLCELVGSLEQFARSSTSLLGESIDPTFGWGMARRVAHAERLFEQTVHSDEAVRRWSEAIREIQVSAHYGGLVITPQFGLLPIGPDPLSGLWEFAHLLSGELPQRNEHGELQIEERTGLVVVLLPGGTPWIGAQAVNCDEPNYDPLLGSDPRDPSSAEPVHQVELSPFFLSKYELTQAQWSRFTGQQPSFHRGWAGGGLLPVESISWDDAATVLFRMGLILPTEAQWEYACRAGTSTPFWCGEQTEQLATVANLYDQSSALRAEMELEGQCEPWDDGSPDLAPVGRYKPNAFGLHDTHGNVAEWCRDGNSNYFGRVRTGDGLRSGWDPSRRILRGGAFNTDAITACSSTRLMESASASNLAIGVRPSRALDP